MTTLSLDDFLGHTTRAPSGRGRTLNWRKRTPAQVDFWFHTRASMISIWGHGFPRVVEIERDGERVKEIWGGKFNCWESEDVCKAQYRRLDDGQRKLPPKVCPMCLLNEWLHAKWRNKELSWTAPIFRFATDDDSQTLTLGGMLGLFNGDLSRQELAELKKAGVRRDEAWKENSNAKCSYLFCGVDHSEPEKGPQVLLETTALGDAVKRVIRDAIEGLGARAGNPMLTPYAIRFQYKANEQEFSKKYNALPLPKAELTPEIREAITETAPPDISEHIARGNIAGLRTAMEQAALIDIPWDVIFGAAEREENGGEESAPRAPARPQARPAQPAAPQAPPEQQTSASGQARRRAPAASPKPTRPDYPPGTVILACDNCGADMADTDPVCWNCGAKYEIDGAPTPPPAPLARPKPAAAPPPESDDAWPGEGDDGVGF